MGKVGNPHPGLALEHRPQLPGALQGFSVNGVCGGVSVHLVQKPPHAMGILNWGCLPFWEP